jgi:hypothetical protein
MTAFSAGGGYSNTDVNLTYNYVTDSNQGPGPTLQYVISMKNAVTDVPVFSGLNMSAGAGYVEFLSASIVDKSSWVGWSANTAYVFTIDLTYVPTGAILQTANFSTARTIDISASSALTYSGAGPYTWTYPLPGMPAKSPGRVVYILSWAGGGIINDTTPPDDPTWTPTSPAPGTGVAVRMLQQVWNGSAYQTLQQTLTTNAP